jgi:hypothetical protein
VTWPLLGLTVLAVVIFAFVLEPVLRAKADRVELDAAAFAPLPEHPTGDDELLVSPSEQLMHDAPPEAESDNRAGLATVERRAIGDLS